MLDEATLIAVFLLFCRIGLCFALAPGLSSPRIPMRARLLLSLGLTLALAPGLMDKALPAAQVSNTAAFAMTIMGECMIGTTLGLMARFMVSALETLSTAIAMSVGMGSMFGPRIDEAETLPEFASFITLCATNLLFVSDQHWELLRALNDSYRLFTIAGGFSPGLGLARLSETLSYAFPLSLRIATPFLIFGLLANLAFGLVNKLAPQIVIYFVSVPFVLAGGLGLLYLLSNSMFSMFIAGLSAMLARG